MNWFKRKRPSPEPLREQKVYTGPMVRVGPVIAEVGLDFLPSGLRQRFRARRIKGLVQRGNYYPEMRKDQLDEIIENCQETRVELRQRAMRQEVQAAKRRKS